MDVRAVACTEFGNVNDRGKGRRFLPIDRCHAAIKGGIIVLGLLSRCHGHTPPRDALPAIITTIDNLIPGPDVGCGPVAEWLGRWTCDQ